MAPLRALLVDYGGVLTTSLAVNFGAFCVETGVDPARLKAVLAAAYASASYGSDLDGLVVSVETGRLPVEEFDRKLAAALSQGLEVPLEETGLAARMFAGAGPDPRMTSAVSAARAAGIRTALVSNTWGRHAYPDGLTGSFDAMVLSGEVRIRKPDPEIYLLAAERIGLAPEECVFVDDIPVNVDGARAVGMAGVLHRDSAITIPKLEALLEVPLA